MVIVTIAIIENSDIKDEAMNTQFCNLINKDLKSDIPDNIDLVLHGPKGEIPELLKVITKDKYGSWCELEKLKPNRMFLII